MEQRDNWKVWGLGGLGLMLGGVGFALLQQRLNSGLTKLGLDAPSGDAWNEAAQQKLAEIRAALSRLQHTIEDLQQGSPGTIRL